MYVYIYVCVCVCVCTILPGILIVLGPSMASNDGAGGGGSFVWAGIYTRYYTPYTPISHIICFVGVPLHWNCTHYTNLLGMHVYVAMLATN
jgi:hypothetical protein